jgi:branched-chain amino acid aminotransferase
MRELCNIDGRIVPLAEATIPVMDRGFLFGDSVYEVMRTHRQVPFAWPEHLARLRRSAAGLGIPCDPADADLVRQVHRTLGQAWEGGERTEAYVRVIVTRGRGTAPSIDLAHAPGPCTTVLVVRPLPAPAAAGVRLALVPRLRVDRRALDPAIKSGNYLNSVLGLAEARQRGADDCLMLNNDGFVTEASTANVFAVFGDVVRTPPLHAGILAGVTREILFAVCRCEGIPAEETDLTPAALRQADELFLSSTLRDVVPVTELDAAPVGRGGPGPRTTRLQAAFSAYVDQRVREHDGPRWRQITADPG